MLSVSLKTFLMPLIKLMRIMKTEGTKTILNILKFVAQKKKKNKCAKPAGDAVIEMDSTLDVVLMEGISGPVLPTKCKFGAGINKSNTSLQKAHALDW